MSQFSPKAPSPFVPASTSICAIGSLVACFGSLFDNWQPALAMLTVGCTGVIMGCATWQWYLWVKGYIDFRLHDELTRISAGAGSTQRFFTVPQV